jgi:hypothetical protein
MPSDCSITARVVAPVAPVFGIDLIACSALVDDRFDAKNSVVEFATRELLIESAYTVSSVLFSGSSTLVPVARSNTHALPVGVFGCVPPQHGHSGLL